MSPRRVTYRELGSCGRLGNQLWQVASTLGFARMRGVEPVFPESWDYRPYFSLPDGWFGDATDLAKGLPVQKLTGLPAGQANYAQQWRFIADVMDEVQDVLRPSRLACDILTRHLVTTDQGYLCGLADKAVTVHVRHGDNTDPATHPPGTWPLVTADYYRHALRVIDATTERPVVFFSDDPDWVTAHISDLTGPWQGCVYVVHSGPTRPPEYIDDTAYRASPPLDWIDLQLMAMFSRHVIGASTYSLWGALLGPGPTTYPNNWVGWRNRPQVPDEATMVPPEWVQVNNPVDPELLHGPC